MCRFLVKLKYLLNANWDIVPLDYTSIKHLHILIKVTLHRTIVSSCTLSLPHLQTLKQIPVQPVTKISSNDIFVSALEPHFLPCLMSSSSFRFSLLTGRALPFLGGMAVVVFLGFLVDVLNRRILESVCRTVLLTDVVLVILTVGITWTGSVVVSTGGASVVSASVVVGPTVVGGGGGRSTK